MPNLADRGFHWLAAAMVVAGGFIAYANTLDGQWVWDDASSVILHRHVQHPAWLVSAWRNGEIETSALAAQLPGAFGQLYIEDQHAFGRGDGNFYRPLLSTTFAVDYLLAASPELLAAKPPGAPASEPGVFWFHLQSILWHLLAALALLLVLIRIGAPRAVLLAVPLLWVLHPLHTEAVAYISGRADMMSGAFLFGGVYFGLSRQPGMKRYLAWGAATLCYALGLLSKEATLILPAVLALALALRALGERSPEQPPVSWLRVLAPVYPCLLVLAGYIALRTTVLNFASGGGGGEVTPLFERLYETVQSFGLYVLMLFLPTGLHMERTLDGVGLLAAMGGALALALLIVAAIVGYRRGVWRVALGVAIFLLCWLPISGIFPLNAPLAEHWMYVPMAGFWLALAELSSRLPRPLAVTAATCAALLCVLFAGLTARRNTDWDNNTRLFEATLAENPNTMRVHYNLAVTLGDLKDNDAGALRHYTAVAQLAGETSEDRLDACLSQAGIHLDSARPLNALEALANGGKGITPDSSGWVHAEYTLGIVRGFFGLGRFSEALRPDRMTSVAANLKAAEAIAESQPVAAALESFALGAPLSEQLHLPGFLEPGR